MRNVTTAAGRGTGRHGTGRVTRDTLLVPILGVCLVVGTAAYLMVFTLMGQIGASLDASRTALDWITVATSIVGTVCAALFPAVGSALGQKRLMTAALACLAAGSLISAVAPDAGMLIAGRILAAPGFAAGSLSVAIVRQHRSRVGLPRAFGVIAACEGAAAGVGFMLGGAIEATSRADWRTVFLAIAAISVITGVVAGATIPGGGGKAPRPDFTGALLLAGGLTAALLPVTEGATWGWTSWRTGALLAVAVVLLATWTGTALARPDPLIELRILARPGVIGGILLFVVTSAAVSIVNITVPAFLEAPPAGSYGAAATVLESGVDLVPFAAAITVAGYIAARLTRRLPPSVIAAVTLCCEALGLGLLAGFHHQVVTVVILVGVVGAGHGGTVAAEYVMLTRAARRAEAGAAAGLGSAAGGISGAVAVAAVTPVLVMRLVRVGPVLLPAAAGYSDAWLCGAALAAGGAIAIGAMALTARGSAEHLAIEN
jgi:MFS family permease